MGFPRPDEPPYEPERMLGGVLIYAALLVLVVVTYVLLNYAPR
jgi:hypothetical protein